ncbi:hypothetical protein RIF29_39424 [Crotalaria pallida]|uniref:Uncharacterized protein n=1 Tax=Crotalaria pallida TaxID=3830 RepID=A0AAN9E6K3_CROPI
MLAVPCYLLCFTVINTYVLTHVSYLIMTILLVSVRNIQDSSSLGKRLSLLVHNYESALCTYELQIQGQEL